MIELEVVAQLCRRATAATGGVVLDAVTDPLDGSVWVRMASWPRASEAASALTAHGLAVVDRRDCRLQVTGWDVRALRRRLGTLVAWQQPRAPGPLSARRRAALMTSVVTVDELVSLRRRRLELDSMARGLRRLGHDVPAEVAAELDTLDGATVEVVIRCLLCGAFGTYPAAVDGDGTPHAAICGACDTAVFELAEDETGD